MSCEGYIAQSNVDCKVKHVEWLIREKLVHLLFAILN